VKTISLRTLVREPLKVKRMTRTGRSVQVTDHGLPLHSLEMGNAIRQRAFHRRHTTPSSERSAIKRERDTSLALLQRYIARRAFIEVSHDMDGAMQRARCLSERHTERLGCRGFDLLHVALALELDARPF
jgi:hypothetical protein